MNVRQMLKDALARWAEFQKKSELTDEDGVAVLALRTEITELEGKVAQLDAAEAALKDFNEKAPVVTRDREETPTGSIGERFTKSAAYRGFRDAHKSGIGGETPVDIKARQIGEKRAVLRADPAPLNSAANGDITSPTRLPGIEDVTYRRPNDLLDLVTVGTTDSSWLEYRQLVSITPGAKIVPEATGTTGTTVADGYKPLSTLATQTADAKAHTYADGVEATNQEMSDDGALVSLIDGILTQNLRDELERVLLNGTGIGGEPKGILNTTGILQQDFSTDRFETLRKAKTLLAETSRTFNPTVLLNPTDEEFFDLAQDKEGRYYGAGPWALAPNNIWSMPRATSALLPAGTALVGDFRGVQLLIREALSILAFNQHADFARRNLVYIRAELRALQIFRQPAKLAVVDLTAV